MGRPQLPNLTKLSPRMVEAAKLLGEGKQARDVAQALGIREATLSAWRNKCPIFHAEVLSHYAEKYDVSVARTMDLATASLGVLAKLMANPDTPPATKCAAALGTLNHQMRILEYQTRVQHQKKLQERLDRLEIAQAQTIEADVYLSEAKQA